MVLAGNGPVNSWMCHSWKLNCSQMSHAYIVHFEHSDIVHCIVQLHRSSAMTHIVTF